MSSTVGAAVDLPHSLTGIELRLRAPAAVLMYPLAQRRLRNRCHRDVVEPAPQAPLLEPVERDDAGHDDRTDDQQARLQIAHRESRATPPLP
jgi:hypothetical protein